MKTIASNEISIWFLLLILHCIRKIPETIRKHIKRKRNIMIMMVKICGIIHRRFNTQKHRRYRLVTRRTYESTLCLFLTLLYNYKYVYSRDWIYIVERKHRIREEILVPSKNVVRLKLWCDDNDFSLSFIIM